jgi:putative CRISPR-associated protein (TIGR02619 family)
MRNRLISTVGTSLISNINADFRPGNGVTEEQHQKLRDFLKAENWGQLARELCKVAPSARICGAEINSIEEARKRRVVLQHIHFLVSDTPDGNNIGKLLETYFIERGLDNLQTVEAHKIESLQDAKPADFRTFGLRNLVREVGKIVSNHMAENIVIDATGGYKAQIAIAVVLGQVLEIPVLYRHERFPEIIDIPPMPIAFDYGLLGQNADILAAFEQRNATLTASEVSGLDEKVRVLLEEIVIEDESVYALGAVGQIYLTGFRLRFPRDRVLQPVPASERREPTFRDDHYPNGFKDFVNKVWRETPWIKACHSLPYDRQRSIRGVSFYVREGKLIGTYQDSNNFGARFEILTNATGDDQLTWAADQLNQAYAG